MANVDQLVEQIRAMGSADKDTDKKEITSCVRSVLEHSSNHVIVREACESCHTSQVFLAALVHVLLQHTKKSEPSTTTNPPLRLFSQILCISHNTLTTKKEVAEQLISCLCSLLENFLAGFLVDDVLHLRVLQKKATKYFSQPLRVRNCSAVGTFLEFFESSFNNSSESNTSFSDSSLLCGFAVFCDFVLSNAAKVGADSVAKVEALWSRVLSEIITQTAPFQSLALKNVFISFFLAKHANAQLVSEHIVPALVRSVKKSNHIGIEKMALVLEHLNIDLSDHVAVLSESISPALLCDNQQSRDFAVKCVSALCGKTQRAQPLIDLCNTYCEMLLSKKSPLTFVYQRICVFGNIHNILLALDRLKKQEAIKGNNILDSLAVVNTQVSEMVSVLSKKEKKEDTIFPLGLVICALTQLFASGISAAVGEAVRQWIISKEQNVRLAGLQCLSGALLSTIESIPAFLPAIQKLPSVFSAAATKLPGRLEAIHSLFGVVHGGVGNEASGLISTACGDKSFVFDPSTITPSDTSAGGILDAKSHVTLIALLLQAENLKLDKKFAAICECLCVYICHSDKTVREHSERTLLQIIDKKNVLATILDNIPSAVSHIFHDIKTISNSPNSNSPKFSVAHAQKIASTLIGQKIVNNLEKILANLNAHAKGAIASSFAVCLHSPAIVPFSVKSGKLYESWLWKTICFNHTNFTGLYRANTDIILTNLKNLFNSTTQQQKPQQPPARISFSPNSPPTVFNDKNSTETTATASSGLTLEMCVFSAVCGLGAVAQIVAPSVVTSRVLTDALTTLSVMGKLRNIPEFELSVWTTTPGTLYRKDGDLVFKSRSDGENIKRDTGQKKLYSVEDEEWERNVRKELEEKNKKAGNKQAQTPQQQPAYSPEELAEIARQNSIRENLWETSKEKLDAMCVLSGLGAFRATASVSNVALQTLQLLRLYSNKPPLQQYTYDCAEYICGCLDPWTESISKKIAQCVLSALNHNQTQRVSGDLGRFLASVLTSVCDNGNACVPFSPATFSVISPLIVLMGSQFAHFPTAVAQNVLHLTLSHTKLAPKLQNRKKQPKPQAAPTADDNDSGSDKESSQPSQKQSKKQQKGRSRVDAAATTEASANANPNAKREKSDGKTSAKTDGKAVEKAEKLFVLEPVTFPCEDICRVGINAIAFGTKYETVGTELLRCTARHVIDISQISVLVDGLFHASPKVRLASSQAILEVEMFVNQNVPASTALTTALWAAKYDSDDECRASNAKLWELYNHSLEDSYATHLVALLSNSDNDVRKFIAQSVAAAVTEFPETQQETLSLLFDSFIGKQPKPRKEKGPAKKPGDKPAEKPVDKNIVFLRLGLTSAIQACGPEVPVPLLPVVFNFLVQHGLVDKTDEVRSAVVSCGVGIIEKHGATAIPVLQTRACLQGFLDSAASSVEGDQVREGVVVYLGALARHLPKGHNQVLETTQLLLETLNTPSEPVQVAVSACLSPLMPLLAPEDVEKVVNQLLERALQAKAYASRRGGTFGLAGAIKGLGLPALTKFKIMDSLKAAVEHKDPNQREGSLMGIECLYTTLGKLFEPYIVSVLPLLLSCASDQSRPVRTAAKRTAKVVMNLLSVHGVKLVMPNLLKSLQEKAWRSRVAAIDLLGSMAYCAPKQLSQCLPQIVPALIDCFSDTHPTVHETVKSALNSVGSVIKSPEISALVPQLLQALEDPNRKTLPALDTLMHTAFVHCVDSPSLALIVPILCRGLKDGRLETKRKTALIVGSMCSLITTPSDILPYLPALLIPLKEVLLDPNPEVRAVAAKGMGTLISGLGESNFPDLVPWLITTMQNGASQVERSGAAQGLAEVLLSLGVDKLKVLLPELLNNTQSLSSNVREGYYSLLQHLPTSFGDLYQPFIGQSMPFIIQGLADEAESVREVAYIAGKATVNLFAFTATDQMVPAIEQGLFDNNYRIRQSSVQLLGNLLFRIVGTSGKAAFAASEENSIIGDAQTAMIVRTLGKERRDRILACLFIMRSDMHHSVKTESFQVWKAVVSHTPATLIEILPAMMPILLKGLASQDAERRQVVGLALGDIVHRLGDKVLPQLVPLLQQSLSSPNAEMRQGVCLGLAELMRAATRQQVQQYIHVILPAVKTALCDSDEFVRREAAEAFNTLHTNVGPRVVDDILPTLLSGVRDARTYESAVDGLREILRRRAQAMFSNLLSALLGKICKEFVRCLGDVVSVCEPPLSRTLERILTPLFNAWKNAKANNNTDMCEAIEGTLQRIAQSVSTQGLHIALRQIFAACLSERTHERFLGTILVSGLCSPESSSAWQESTADILSQLVGMLADDDVDVVKGSTSALSSLVKTLAPESMPQYIGVVRDAISRATAAISDQQSANPRYVIVDVTVTDTLQAILPLFLHSLISTADSDIRQHSALGIGELVSVTHPSALRKYAAQMTGPLIRIFGERCAPSLKAAILQTITALLKKGGVLLKPFVPQLQPTCVKALRDSETIVRERAVVALEQLVALSPRIEPLVTELLNDAQNHAEIGVRIGMIQALERVIASRREALGQPIVQTIVQTMATIANTQGSQSQEDGLRESSAVTLGTACALVTDDAERETLITRHMAKEPTAWQGRHNQALSLLGFVSAAESSLVTDMLPLVAPAICAHIADDKVNINLTGLQCLTAVCGHVGQSQHKAIEPCVVGLATAMQSKSSDVKLAALKTAKTIAKQMPQVTDAHLQILIPAMFAAAKEKTSVAVKIAGERCLIHTLHLSKGTSTTLTNYLKTAEPELAKQLTEYSSRVLSRLVDTSDKEDAA